MLSRRELLRMGGASVLASLASPLLASCVSANQAIGATVAVPERAWKDLERAFSYYGPIRSVWVARNPPGFAFVEFEDSRDADDAVRGLDGR